ncbi:GNAT family N-acetyltransferase [Erythrobacter aquimaris]|uniref:GNAT family N-acetyltransferase n=1 Tax=Qipengyuania aquimaris TaxID=255984 RepID=A0A6I4TJN8_9SPHN|nr:GNAT family N-acetyltransferase [Qipengyuania aquimaris]MXO95459.1 GNAT family N-acetyltransferase [Qipengyuania aquimaris]
MTSIIEASLADAAEIKLLIESAYRGDSARQGWNHEADLLDDERTSLEEIERLIKDEKVSFQLARGDAGAPIGCVAVTQLDATCGYLGMLCVSPTMQSGGLGGTLLEAAELAALKRGIETLEMTVITQRSSLISWYKRRGYKRTSETRPFPVPRDPPLEFAVLAKRLADT